MNIPQTTYNEFPAALVNGMVTENGPRKKVSRSAQTAMTVGTFCLFGTDGPSGPNPGQAKAIPDGTASLALALGVVVFDSARSPYSTAIATSSGSGQYAIGETVPVLRQGEIAVYAENAVTQGNPVYVRCTAAGTDVNGQVRDGAAANFVLHPTATFQSSTTAAGLALIEVK